jgi:hypothetical protein
MAVLGRRPLGDNDGGRGEEHSEENEADGAVGGNDRGREERSKENEAAVGSARGWLVRIDWRGSTAKRRKLAGI